ncbi:hypothetical protein KY343_07245 [Candidatus Woesearchaeota archaeon]|nr:hypothetical protein [Candidatus Woesearchaeota archaeon]
MNLKDFRELKTGDLIYKEIGGIEIRVVTQVLVSSKSQATVITAESYDTKKTIGITSITDSKCEVWQYCGEGIPDKVKLHLLNVRLHRLEQFIHKRLK